MNLNIRIKGKTLWMVCATLVIGIMVAACAYFVDGVEQPDSATAGSRITVKVKLRVQPVNVASGNPPWNSPIIFGFCVPRGWKVKEHDLKLTYVFDQGDGKPHPMSPVQDNAPATQPEGLTWAEAFKNQYGNGGNFVDDVEWVVYQTDNILGENGDSPRTGTITIDMMVGADQVNGGVDMLYAFTDVAHGFYADGANGVTFNTSGYYASKTKECFEITGGTSGETVNYCQPQRITPSPAKGSSNDLVSFTFDNNLVANSPFPRGGNTKLYMSMVGYAADDTELPLKLTQNVELKQTTGTSGKFLGTIWPADAFDTSNKPLARITYYITDNATVTRADDINKVGLQEDPYVDFAYLIRCN
ncbi:DUF4961 domain-containing protein [Mucilaginibacter limnophilus]|uniref:DUF4961 domain-containing protein n=1 Tax=Mucilaginibacter limnophilus TaxID=1932778 RepID=A0A437MY74_9SPHI|nr:DUF4961 domain-containing protein [Mucilaginibacter limnophilus]RVU02608.1 DUF4961 domain-containing protein [Mucilaginibacter limnophilus]